MNIKKIYPVLLLSAVLMVGGRFLGILMGTEMPSGLTLGNFFSFAFLIVSALAFLIFLFISKFSYGVSKLSELTLSKKAIVPAFIAMGVGFLGDAFLSFRELQKFGALEIIPIVLALLSFIAFIVLALEALKDSKKPSIILFSLPVLYYAATLIKVFFTNMSSLSNTTAGVLTFKIIFVLLFFLYLLIFLIDPESLKGAGSVIHIGAFSVCLTLSVIIPSVSLYFADKQKFGVLLNDISFSDIFFIPFSIVFIKAIISAIEEKSNSLKAKVSEE